MDRTERIVISINFREKKTISEQLQEEIRKRVIDGRLAPGSQLPTVRELADQIRVNFNTVARAYRVLDYEGWISTQQGRGTFVTEKLEEQGKSNPGKGETLKRLAEEILSEANRLNTAPEELLKELLRQFGLRAQPAGAKNRRQKEQRKSNQSKYLHTYSSRWRNVVEKKKDKKRKQPFSRR